MIAVIGAGGATGLECVRLLASQGVAVRCLVRDPKKYEGKFGSAEVVAGSATDEASLRAGLQGASGVVFAASASSYSGEGGPYEVDYLGVEKAARAAAACGIEKFVLISSRLVHPQNRWNLIRGILNNIKYSLMDYKWEGEEALRKSGLAQYVVIRPGGLLGGEGGMARPTDVQPRTQHLLFGAAEADLGSSRSIHRTDVAAVACEALKSSEAGRKTVELVARPREEGDPSFDEQLGLIFKELPVDAAVS